MSAIEHRFRPVRKQADGLRLAVTRGDDPEEVDIHEPRGMKHLGNINTSHFVIILKYLAVSTLLAAHIILVAFLNMANTVFRSRTCQILRRIHCGRPAVPVSRRQTGCRSHEKRSG